MQTLVWQPGGDTLTGVSVTNWFTRYLEEFAALGRGDVADERRILAYYGVPMVFSGVDGSEVLASEDDVLAVTRRQITALKAADYARTEEISAHTTILNSSCALRHSRFVRFSRDNNEFGRVAATYLIACQPSGMRITALVIHSAFDSH